MSRKERVETFFNQLRLETLDSLGEFYASEVVFEDPITRLDGVQALTDYYRAMYKEVLEISFAFTSMVEEGDSLMAAWTMRLRTRKLAGQRPIVVEGISHLRFDGERVVYHRDAFDMGAMVYEHIPILGWLIRLVKSLFKH
ncbi:MAG: nuclear transport factor 2 family protein [Candidatus Eremiobacteraeota bacterium]|nr:nuclear transport factor 2 family protein [Candidatus Eremiobacteraeota bacterium]